MLSRQGHPGKGKNVTVGKSSGNQHFPKGMLASMQDRDTTLTPVQTLPVTATSPEAKSIADLKDCLYMMRTALLWRKLHFTDGVLSYYETRFW